MASVNKAILIGNLGSDPELRYTPQGTAVTHFNIATAESWIKDGVKSEKTEWHRIVVWGKQAENCNEYLSKGRQVYIEGRIQTRSWDDKEGNKKYTTEIVANIVQLLGSPRDKTVARTETKEENIPEPSSSSTNEETPIGNDEVPF